MGEDQESEIECSDSLWYPIANLRRLFLILAMYPTLTLEQLPPIPLEPVAKPYWTAVKIVVLILVILVGVFATGVGLYYRLAPANVVIRTGTCSNGATNFPSCTNCASGQSLVSGACHANCSNGATNPPSCNNNENGPFCLAFNFGDAEYSQNSTGWYITLYVQNFCSDRSLTVSPVHINGTTFPGPWTLPPGYAPYGPFYSGPPPTQVVICMSCAGQVFVPCAIYFMTVVVSGSGTSSGASTTQTRGEGWQCR